MSEHEHEHEHEQEQVPRGGQHAPVTGPGATGGPTGGPGVRLPGRAGDPWALGLAAFATTTFLFGLSYTTIWSGAVTGGLLVLALIYGGAIQILAGIWAFAYRMSFAGTVFCSFGAFYLTYYLLVHQVALTMSRTDQGLVMGVFLLAWLIFGSYILLAATQLSPTATVVYFFWALAYLLLVLGYFLTTSDLLIAGGASAIAAAAAAWYTSFANLVAHGHGRGRISLPVFPGATHPQG